MTTIFIYLQYQNEYILYIHTLKVNINKIEKKNDKNVYKQ